MYEAYFSAGALPAMAIALGFALGLRTYGCLCALGVMARMQWVQLPVGLGGLASWWVMGCFGALAAGEFVLDKVPGMDVIWNLLQTAVRVPAVGFVVYMAAAPLPFAARVGMAILGMGFAGLGHGATIALRLAVVSRPELMWNVALSLVEDGVALGLGWLAFRSPLQAGTIAMWMAGAALCLGCCGLGRIRRGLLRRFGERRVVAGALTDRKQVLSTRAKMVRSLS